MRWLALILAALPAQAELAKPVGAELGRAIYTNCAACHGEAGQGAIAPPFAGNSNLADAPKVIAQVLHGSAIMPPFREQLSDEEVAAVVNHIRNSWGNHAALVGAADIRRASPTP
jgi:cytochrome c oxidase cbb3-type subunit II